MSRSCLVCFPAAGAGGGCYPPPANKGQAARQHAGGCPLLDAAQYPDLVRVARAKEESSTTSKHASRPKACAVCPPSLRQPAPAAAFVSAMLNLP
jgi:hypothetical protein